MSADNYIEAVEQEDGTFSVYYGYMSDDGPGRRLKRGLTLREANRFIQEYEDNTLGRSPEYGPYWHFLELPGRAGADGAGTVPL